MSLGIIKKSKKEEIALHERKKANNGYIWKSGRDINLKKKNYADKILKSHQQNKKKKKKKERNEKKDKMSRQSSSLMTHSIAIQSEPTNIEEEKEENVSISISSPQIKQCC